MQIWSLHFFILEIRRGRDRMVVGFTTTYAIRAYHYLRCEFEFRSCIQCKIMWSTLSVQIWLRLCTRYNIMWNIVESGAKHHNPNRKIRTSRRGQLIEREKITLPDYLFSHKIIVLLNLYVCVVLVVFLDIVPFYLKSLQICVLFVCFVKE